MIVDFNNESKEVLIYPHPAYEFLNFGKITNEVTVNISDIIGKIILQKIFPKQMQALISAACIKASILFQLLISKKILLQKNL